MADWNDQRTGVGYGTGIDSASVPSTVRDGGLRKHMLSIYNYMTSGILLSGVIALIFAQGGENSLAAQLFATGGILAYVVMLSPLAIVIAMSFGANRFSAPTLQLMFWAFAALMGASLSTIFLVYTTGSITLTFFATAAAFAGLSLFGYTTKKDMSGMGTFLIMGVVGLLVAMLLNLWLQSSGMTMAISAIGVLIFAGLTAYDTQRLKAQYQHVRGTQMAQKAVILGALTLYLDFINMFQFLLAFLGGRE